jgi:penicillin-binding protein 2
MRFFIPKIKKRKINQEIDPDIILLDAQNLPGFDTDQFEGRMEKPIGNRSIWGLELFLIVILLIFIYEVFELQIVKGKTYREQSENNRLRHELIFANRGLIYDRNNQILAWNEPNKDESAFNTRVYKDPESLALVLGYVNYPRKDSQGFYYNTELTGKEGIELNLNNILSGKNGLKLIETDVHNQITSASAMESPKDGENVMLTIDSRIQSKLYESIKNVSDEKGFRGGAGVILDIYTGDVIAMASYPTYNSNIMSEGKDIETINSYQKDNRQPFLNKVTDGLFTPGSIIKPILAFGALKEKVIDPAKKIVSEGEMLVPNPYNPDNPSVFSDWKAHGPVNMQEAIAVSSNIYFYQVGGGYKDQKGLGITNIEKYMKIFGLGEGFKNDFFDGPDGTIPNPEWKKKNFNDDWRLGDTYFTSIGQYGVQTTPLQIARVYSAIATNGLMVEPRILADESQTIEPRRIIDLPKEDFEFIKEALRMTVTQGTAQALNFPDAKIAGKTGTAELGVTKAKVNSWFGGFFPYDNPKYAFAFVLEQGDRNTSSGAVTVAIRLFDWMRLYTGGYFK